MKSLETHSRLVTKPADNVPSYIVVHHGGGTDIDPLADTSHHSAAMVEQWHKRKGWEGMGYHFYIEKDGDIWRGRPEHYHGAHATIYNKKSIGICLAGNFDVTLPTDAQVLALRQLLISMSDKYGIKPKNIIPHRTVAKKSCYGHLLSDDWARNLLKEEEQVITLRDATLEQLVQELLVRINKKS